MKTKFGKTPVTITPLNFDKLSSRRRAAIEDRYQVLRQIRHCRTKAIKPNPARLGGFLYTKLCPHIRGVRDGAKYIEKQKLLEKRFLDAAGLKNDAKGVSRKLSDQFMTHPFKIPYKEWVLGTFKNHTVTLVTKAHYHVFEVRAATLRKGEFMTLMLPHKVTHQIFVHGECRPDGTYAVNPFGPESKPMVTVRVNPTTTDGKLAKADYRKRRIKELEKEIDEREKIIELIEDWLESLEND